MQFAQITDRLAHTGGAKWVIHLHCRTLQKQGKDIIELTIGEPDVSPDPALVDIAHKAMLAGRVGYSSGRGEPELVDALVTRYRKRRTDVRPENVLCFPGAQTALFATMMGLTEAGDGVLVGDPLYASYEGVIRASGAHIVSVALNPENGFRMKSADIEAAITPQCKVLLLNTPQNPTGAVIDAAGIAEICAVCEAHNLWLVCDEVYEELVFDGPFFSPFDNPSFADRVVVLSSISKTYAAPGFRSGWVIGPKEFCDRLLPLSETMLFGNQPFIADMTAWALSSELTTAKQMRTDYRRRAIYLAGRLNGIPGIQPFSPQAGMFMLADVSMTGLDGEAFAWRLLDAGVAVMPGSSFGLNARNFIRISLTVPDRQLAHACDRIEAFVKELSVN